MKPAVRPHHFPVESFEDGWHRQTTQPIFKSPAHSCLDASLSCLPNLSYSPQTLLLNVEIKDFAVSFLHALCFRLIKLAFKFKCNNTTEAVIEIKVCCTRSVKNSPGPCTANAQIGNINESNCQRQSTN